MRSTVAAPRPIWSHWARQTGWLAAMLVVFVTMLTPVSLYYPGMWQA